MMKKLKILFTTIGFLLLGGCKIAMLDPKGVIAATQKQLLIDATLLMLIVVIPAILMSFFFIWRYRERKGSTAKYTADWSHNTMIEVVCWAIPCLIIIALAILTWVTTHTLDPYRPLDVKKKPLVIEVVALDWKWLFIYPEQHIATVNYARIPTGTPVLLKITADAPMNSIEIPQLAGQIYAMPGMRTKLNLMATSNGRYNGFSANFSGDGFSEMNFIVEASSENDFNKWAQTAQRTKEKLTIARYKELVRPSVDNPVAYFSQPADHLFNDIIMSYMMPMKTMATPTAQRK